jgi:ADP-ribose pyrophosphatase YjhB (NUDIX family)
LADAAKRETKEETGYDSKISFLLGVYKCKKGDNSWIYTVSKADLVHGGEGKRDPGVTEGRWFTKEEFIKLEQSRIVHSDMKLVYKIAIENRGLGVESVKYIEYDAQ